MKQESSLSEEVSELTSSLAQAQEARKTAESELTELHEDTHSQISHLVESVEQKSKAGLLLRTTRSSIIVCAGFLPAVEQLTMALEDEREQIKALKKKHMSNTKDLQRQIAHCKR